MDWDQERKTSQDHVSHLYPHEKILLTASERHFQLRSERLEKLASSLTAWDIQAYTSIIENSRRAKNYLWRSDPIAIWPDWHEGLLLSSATTASPLPSLFEIKYDSPNQMTVGSAITRPSSRGRSITSPVLTPLPMHRDARSLSPGLSLDDDRRYTDSDFSDNGLSLRYGARHQGSRLRKNVYVSSSKSGSPRMVDTSFNSNSILKYM